MPSKPHAQSDRLAEPAHVEWIDQHLELDQRVTARVRGIEANLALAHRQVDDRAHRDTPWRAAIAAPVDPSAGERVHNDLHVVAQIGASRRVAQDALDTR